VNALIPACPPDAAGGMAAAARSEGFRCVKVKVGRGDDVSRVAAVRDAVGPSMAVRVDANGAWDLDTAARRITELAPLDVELVEQPVPGLDDLARLRRSSAVPLAADESVRGLEDARRLRRLAAADAVVLKVQPLGGVRAALEVMEAAGAPGIVTSMLETSVGLAAGLALAAALDALPYACGLGTASLLAADVVADPLVPHRGRLAVRRPQPDLGLLDRYSVG
jgi:O-succinylbenzoate synthase